MSGELRVLSYNVRSLRDDERVLTAVIRGCEPDVVCVQEAPRFLRWRSRCARLARESGLVVVTGGRTAGAMLLLCRAGVEVVEARDVLLTKTPRLHQRGLAVGVLRLAGRPFVVASMHLGLRADERRRHVDEILGLTERVRDRHGAPLLLAGDVNEEPGAPVWSVLAGRLQDAYAVAPDGDGRTYSSADPQRRIDAVFVDRRVVVLACGVPACGVPACGVPVVDGLARASDHRPLLARLALPG